MATLTPPEEAQTGTPDLDAFEHHWQDEADAAAMARQQGGPDLEVSVFNVSQTPIDVLLGWVRLGIGQKAIEIRRIGLVLPMMLECVEVGGVGLRFFRWGERGHGRNMTSWRRRCRIADIRPPRWDWCS